MMRMRSGIVAFGLVLVFAASVNAAPILQVDIGGDFVTGGFQVVQASWSAFDLHELAPGFTDTATHSYGPITMSITATIYGETVGLTFGQGPCAPSAPRPARISPTFPRPRRQERLKC